MASDGGNLTLRVSIFLPASRASGPGRRALIGVPDSTTPALAVQILTVDTLFRHIVALGSTIEGITLCGRNPLAHPPAIHSLLRRIKTETSLSVVLSTPLSWEEIAALGKEATDILQDIDMLLAAYPHAGQPVSAPPTGGEPGREQIVFLSDRYTQETMQAVPSAEIIVTTEGDIIVAGVDPPSYETADNCR